MTPRPPSSPLFPYTTLFRSVEARRLRTPPISLATTADAEAGLRPALLTSCHQDRVTIQRRRTGSDAASRRPRTRSEEHTSELQSHSDLVCRLLLEKKKKNIN